MVRHLIMPPERARKGGGGAKKKGEGKGNKKAKPTRRTPLLVPLHVPPPSDEAAGAGRVPRAMTVAEKRQTAWDLRISGYNTPAIAKALELSEARVYEILREYSRDLAKYTEAAREEWRTLELARLDKLLVTYWVDREIPKYADIILRVLERRHKLQGLDHTNKTITVETSDSAVSLNNLDLSKLTNEELEWLEIIISKALPVAIATGTVVEGEFQALPNPDAQEVPHVQGVVDGH